MARMSLKGFEEYLAELQRIHGSSEELAKRALYEGAGVVADKIKQNLQNIPTRDPKKYYRDTKAPGLSPAEKSHVVSHFGLSHMKTEGSAITIRAGFSGQYVTKSKDGKTKRISTNTLARYAESGTSWIAKNPTIRKAANAARNPAIEAMRKRYDSDIERITG